MDTTTARRVVALIRQAATLAHGTNLATTLNDTADEVERALPTPKTRAPFWFTVARDIPAAKCLHCPATIYFVPTKNGRHMPVRCDIEGGAVPTKTEDGRGLSHFADCPGADRARKS